MNGTGSEKDTSVVKQDSSGSGKETSKVPETLTQEQIVEKAVNDALSKAGRTAKSLNELQQRLEKDKVELTAKQVAWQKERDESEELAVRDDPEALATLRAGRRKKADDEAKVTELTDREAKLAKSETEHAEALEQIRVINRTQLVSEVSVATGVPIDTLLKLAKEDTREAYEAVAEVLPKVKEPHVLKPDSGRTIGGTNWRDLTTDQKIARGLGQK